MALALVLRTRMRVRWLAAPAAGLAVAAAASACFTAGQGTQPPLDTFYFPTGLAVSPDAKVLYAINSDFDLQWNGGTLQTYNLTHIREDASNLIAANVASSKACAMNARSPTCTNKPASLDPIPFVTQWTANCMNQVPVALPNSVGVELGTSCSPPVDSTNARYFAQSAIVGAFAEDLRLVQLPNSNQLRLFTPMAGNSTVTWADVGTIQSPSSKIDCGQGSGSRCDAAHQTGNDPNSVGNSRNLTMPGEPYGIAFTEDKTAMAVTSETDTKSSLLTSSSSFPCSTTSSCPTMQFVVDSLPSGGIAMATVPHDKYAVTRCEDVGDQEPCVRPAFLETFVGAAEVDLLRYYDDLSYTTPSSQYRPYLVRERAISIPTNIGSDFRGIAVDPTPRYRCEASATSTAERQACGELPARLFIASRTPPSVVYGEIGLPSYGVTYDPDALVFLGNIPLSPGPSKVYFAPIIVRDPDTGQAHYEPRIFVVLFDSAEIVIINPETVPPSVENKVSVGLNPYGMTFDPFGDDAASNPNAPSMTDIATHKAVPALADVPAGQYRYRFGYVGVFTQSYVQMIDLDDSALTGTWEQVVYNLGEATIPKGQANSNNGGSFL